MKITTTKLADTAEFTVDNWVAEDHAGRKFYGSTEAEATAMALAYNQPRKRESRVSQVAEQQQVRRAA